MDRVIQDNQPLVMVVRVGAVLALVSTTLLGLWRPEGPDRLLVVAASAIYLLGVLLPTAAVSLPLNRRLQAQEVEALGGPFLHQARREFEHRWTRSNAIRTVFAIATPVALMILLSRQ